MLLLLVCYMLLSLSFLAYILYIHLSFSCLSCTLVSLLKLFQLLFPSFCVSVALLVFSHVTFAV